MSDTELDVERRAQPSRAGERARTAIGCGLAVVGAACVLAPILRTGSVTALPLIAGLAFLVPGCIMIVPGVFVPFFKPLVSQAISLLPSLRKS